MDKGVLKILLKYEGHFYVSYRFSLTTRIRLLFYRVISHKSKPLFCSETQLQLENKKVGEHEDVIYL